MLSRKNLVMMIIYQRNSINQGGCTLIGRLIYRDKRYSTQYLLCQFLEMLSLVLQCDKNQPSLYNVSISPLRYLQIPTVNKS